MGDKLSDEKGCDSAKEEEGGPGECVGVGACELVGVPPCIGDKDRRWLSLLAAEDPMERRLPAGRAEDATGLELYVDGWLCWPTSAEPNKVDSVLAVPKRVQSDCFL